MFMCVHSHAVHANVNQVLSMFMLHAPARRGFVMFMYWFMLKCVPFSPSFTLGPRASDAPVQCLLVFGAIGGAIGGRAEANLKRASDAPVQCLLVFRAIGGAIGGCAEANLKRASDAPVQCLLVFGAIGGAIGGRAEANLKRASDAPMQCLLVFGAIGGRGRPGAL
jgi:hypothetical protein